MWTGPAALWLPGLLDMNGRWASRARCVGTGRRRSSLALARRTAALIPGPWGQLPRTAPQQAAASCAWVGLVRVAAHHPDQAGDVLLVPALAVDVVRVSVAGEEPADHLPQVLVAAGLAAGLGRLDAGAHRLLVLSAAGAGLAMRDIARASAAKTRAASAAGTSAARGGPRRGSRRRGSGAWRVPSPLPTRRGVQPPRFRWERCRAAAITGAASCAQQPHLGVRSPGSRPCAHSWSARWPSRPASIGQAPPASRIAAR